EREVKTAEEAIKIVVNALLGRVGFVHTEWRTDIVLRLFDGLESPRRHKRKDRRTQAGHAFCWYQHRPPQHVRVHTIEHFVFLRNAAGVDYALYAHAIRGHAIENDPRVQRCALDSCKEFVLSSALEVPAKCDAAQIRIYQNGTVTVVPGEAQETSLSGAIVLQALAQSGDIGSSAAGDGIEDIANGRETSFNARTQRVNTSLHNSAHPGHKIRRRRNADDAGRGTHDVHHVVGATASTDGVPVRVEGTDGNWNARFEAKPFGPVRRKAPGDLVRRGVFAFKFVANTREQRINLGEELIGWKPTEVGVPKPLVPHGADATLHFLWISDAAKGGGDHVAVFEC